MSFADDMAFANIAKPLQDEVYQYMWPGCIIRRYSKEDNFMFDRDFHIDVEITLPNQSKIWGQEKALRRMYSKYNTFTMEYYQNRKTCEKGEFFNIHAQFYLHGYLNIDSPLEDTPRFTTWHLIDLFRLFDWLSIWTSTKLESHTRPSSSRASFFQIDYDLLPKDCVMQKF